MIWQSPWALAGLLAVGLPVLIHLLSRKQAAIQKFPTLRFLDVSRLLPTRTPKLTDIPLLLVRIGIIASAVVAMAGPLFGSARRTRAFNETLARAIVVDTSESVLRLIPNRAGATDSLVAHAGRIAAEAQASVTLQTASVSPTLAGAIAWLGTQTSRGEVVVMSDFQAGTVDSAALSHIPRQYGVRLIRVAGVANDDSASPHEVVTQSALVRVSPETMSTGAEWLLPTPKASRLDDGITLLASSEERSQAELARTAALEIGAPRLADTVKSVSIVYPGAATYMELIRNAKAPNQRWMGDLIGRAQASPLLSAALLATPAIPDTIITAPFVVLARDANGSAAVFGAQAMVGGREQFVFFARTKPGSALSAALIATIQQIVSVSSVIPEIEPRTLSDSAISALQRVPGQVSGVQRFSNSDYASADASDARWFWVLALALLAVEALMRNARRNAPGFTS